MWPYVIKDPITIGTYGVMMATGFLSGYYLMKSEFLRRHIGSESDADWLVFFMMITGVIGAKLAYLLTEADHFSIKAFFSGAGLTWHGGLILAALTTFGYILAKKMPFWVTLDAIAPELATGYGIGRIGCQLAGDGDYGLHCAAHLPWPLCMSYPHGVVPTMNIVYATPIYETIGSFILFGVLWSIRKRIKHPGVLFGVYLVFAGIMRFAVEFIRQTESRPYRFWHLRDAQLIALGELVIGLALWAYMAYRKVPEGLEYGIVPMPEKVETHTKKRRKHKSFT